MYDRGGFKVRRIFELYEGIISMKDCICSETINYIKQEYQSTRLLEKHACERSIFFQKRILQFVSCRTELVLSGSIQGILCSWHGFTSSATSHVLQKVHYHRLPDSRIFTCEIRLAEHHAQWRQCWREVQSSWNHNAVSACCWLPVGNALSATNALSGMNNTACRILYGSLVAFSKEQVCQTKQLTCIQQRTATPPE